MDYLQKCVDYAKPICSSTYFAQAVVLTLPMQ